MPMMIDLYQHIIPIRYKDQLVKKVKDCFYVRQIEANPALFNLDLRLRFLENHPGVQQVLTIGHPPLELDEFTKPTDAIDLAKLSNDEMAEIVSKYPDRLTAAVANLPMSDIDASLKETDRAIKDLHFKGIQLFTPINGKSMDSPEFWPLYEKIQTYNVPIWIHPQRDIKVPDYCGETESKFSLFSTFGWPYETTLVWCI
jgi:predicted TIM-barrel fold metal-dependent hydrolase